MWGHQQGGEGGSWGKAWRPHRRHTAERTSMAGWWRDTGGWAPAPRVGPLTGTCRPGGGASKWPPAPQRQAPRPQCPLANADSAGVITPAEAKRSPARPPRTPPRPARPGLTHPPWSSTCHVAKEPNSQSKKIAQRRQVRWAPIGHPRRWRLRHSLNFRDLRSHVLVAISADFVAAVRHWPGSRWPTSPTQLVCASLLVAQASVEKMFIVLLRALRAAGVSRSVRGGAGRPACTQPRVSGASSCVRASDEWPMADTEPCPAELGPRESRAYPN